MARTRYKETGFETPRSQKAVSADFLQAELPPDTSEGFVDTILGVMEGIVDEANNATGELLKSEVPTRRRNLIELISKKQEEESLGDMGKLQSSLSETIEKFKGGKQAAKTIEDNAIFTGPSLETETALVPLSLTDNIREVKNMIANMEKAIQQFNKSALDELQISGDVDDMDNSVSIKILRDIKRCQHSLEKWNSNKRANNENRSSNQLIERITEQLSHIPTRKSPDTLVETEESVDTLPPLRKSVLKNLAELLGMQAADSLNSSVMSAHDSSSSIIDHSGVNIRVLDAFASDVTVPFHIESDLSAPWTKTGPTLLYSEPVDFSVPPSDKERSHLESELARLNKVMPPLPHKIAPESTGAYKPLDLSLVKDISSPHQVVDKEYPITPSYPQDPLPDINNETGGNSISNMNDAPISPTRSPVRRANRRIGNYTIKLTSPVKTVPFDFRHSPTGRSSPSNVN